MIFAIIPFLILKYRSKRSNYLKDEQNESKLNIELIHYDIFLANRASKFKLIGISTIFDFFQTLFGFLFCTRCVYNFIILILGLILNVIEYFKSDDNTNKLDAFEILMKFLNEIFLSLSVVIIKYNLEKNYCSPYEICIWEGFLWFNYMYHCSSYHK